MSERVAFQILGTRFVGTGSSLRRPAPRGVEVHTLIFLLFLLTCLFLPCRDQCREPFGHLELHLGTPFLGGSLEWGLVRPFHGRTGRKVGFPEEGSGDSYRSPVRWEVTRGGLSLPSAGHDRLRRCPITGSFWVRPKSRRCISHATVFVSRCCDR